MAGREKRSMYRNATELKQLKSITKQWEVAYIGYMHS